MTSTIRPADQDGIRWSVYVCPTKRRSEYLCKGRATSEVVLGEFVFNYILNMLNVQKNFDSINSVEDMEKMLLSGSTFRDVDGIERAGLDDLYNMLASGLTEKAPFDSSVEVRKKPVVSDIELENLNTEKDKDRAGGGTPSKSLLVLRRLHLSEGLHHPAREADEPAR